MCRDLPALSAPFGIITPKDRQVGNQEIQGNISMEPTWAGLSENKVRPDITLALHIPVIACFIAPFFNVMMVVISLPMMIDSGICLPDFYLS